METVINYFKKENNKIAFIVFVILLIGSISLFTIFYIKMYSVSEAGQIGDTVAGILGTCVNLGAALLVYVSFREQVKANKDIAKQLKDERLFRLMELSKPSAQVSAITDDYFNYRKECLAINTFGNLKLKNYESFDDIKLKIVDNETEFENLYDIFLTAKRAITDDLDDVQLKIIQNFERIVSPYIWYVDIFNKKNQSYFSDEFKVPEIPIIKIQYLGDFLNKMTLINFSKQNSNKIIIKELIIIDENNTTSSFQLDKEMDYPQKSVKAEEIIDFNNIEIGRYSIIWKIEYNNKLYSYKDEYIIQ
ncbi:MAG: hypothetical protein WAT37_11695 [Saprospiraceae bacterium]